jgi:hypothetical protein
VGVGVVGVGSGDGEARHSADEGCGVGGDASDAVGVRAVAVGW